MATATLLKTIITVNEYVDRDVRVLYGYGMEDRPGLVYHVNDVWDLAEPSYAWGRNLNRRMVREGRREVGNVLLSDKLHNPLACPQVTSKTIF